MSANTKILIVEDEPLIAADIDATLNDLGYIVDGIAHTAQEAIAFLQSNHPDLVLLDITLGVEQNGLQVAEYLRQNTELPFIFLTSHSDKATLDKAKKYLPNAYLLKPFNETDLLTTIEIVIYGHRQQVLKSEIRPELETLNRKLPTAITDREFDILLGIYEGMSNKEMTDNFHVSINTIKKHINSLYLKFEVNSRTTLLVKIRVLMSA
ncbi:MAG: response regulator [Bacteroidia bacterium]|nr:response regulator [Bacteroidia bacterium]